MSFSSAAGFIVICVVPLPLTCPPVTLISSTRVLSARKMEMLPLSAFTASEKFKTMFDVVATPVALSSGEVDLSVGGVRNVIGTWWVSEFLFANAR